MTDGYKRFFKTLNDVKSPPGGNKNQKESRPFKISKTRTSSPKVDVEEQLRRAVRRSSKPVPQGPPWRALITLSLTLMGLGFYFAAPDVCERWYRSFEVSALGQASAEAEKAAPKAKSEEKPAAPATKPGTTAGNEETPKAEEDLSHFQKLKQRKEELDLREKELTQLEEELQRQKVELDKRIAQLEEMRTQIAQVLKDRVELDQEKVTKLVDLYSNMKPKQAAEVLGSINEDLAVEVLAKMKKKSAAEIMNLLPADKAKILSEKYTGYRRSLANESKGS